MYVYKVLRGWVSDNGLTISAEKDSRNRVIVTIPEKVRSCVLKIRESLFSYSGS